MIRLCASQLFLLSFTAPLAAWAQQCPPKAKEFLPFEEARIRGQKWVRPKSRADWLQKSKLMAPAGFWPPGVPVRPDMVYQGRGWTGWRHWCGTLLLASPGSSFLAYESARELAQREIRATNVRQWRELREEAKAQGTWPRGVPCRPDAAYKNAGWTGWPAWFGTGPAQPGEKDAFWSWRQTAAGDQPAAGQGWLQGTPAPEDLFAAFGWRGVAAWLDAQWGDGT